jgi:hypothetical protein
MNVEEFSGKNEDSTFLEKIGYTLDITFTPITLYTTDLGRGTCF